MNRSRVTTGAQFLRIATWNIHDARGTDGRRDVGRVAQVIHDLQASIIGLQEVACGPADTCDVAWMAKSNHFDWRAIPTRGPFDLQHGNALLTSLPIEKTQIHDLTVSGREPRGALETRLIFAPYRLRVVVTHLGLRAGERRWQVEQLLSKIHDDDVDATILLGDINEWWLWGRPLRWLHHRFGTSPSLLTFPSRMPLFALDRIWVHPRSALLNVAKIETKAARQASDHLPVVATVQFPSGTSEK